MTLPQISDYALLGDCAIALGEEMGFDGLACGDHLTPWWRTETAPARAAGGQAPVTLICAEPLPPYRRPPLTKEFLRGRITRDELLMRPADWYIAHDIDVRLGTSAASLHPASRTLVTDAGEEIAFSECVLCTGSQAMRPSLPGARAGVST